MDLSATMNLDYWTFFITVTVQVTVLAAGLLGDYHRFPNDNYLTKKNKISIRSDPSDLWFQKVVMFWLGVSILASCFVGIVLQVSLGGHTHQFILQRGWVYTNLSLAGIIAILESKGKLCEHSCLAALFLHCARMSYAFHVMAELPKENQEEHYSLCLYHFYLVFALLNTFAIKIQNHILSFWISHATAITSLLLLCFGGMSARYAEVPTKLSPCIIDTVLFPCASTIAYAIILTSRVRDAAGAAKKRDMEQPLLCVMDEHESSGDLAAMDL